MSGPGPGGAPGAGSPQPGGFRGALDAEEARLRRELELIKERWLKSRSEDINYFKEALYNQYNLITVFGLAGLSLVAPPFAPLFLATAAAWEVCWLGIAPFSARFRRATRASRNAAALEQAEKKRDLLLDKLPEELKKEHEAAAAIADEIRRQAEASEEGELELLEETIAKLDYLLEQYARMLLALHRTRELLDSSEGRTLEQRVGALERELEKESNERLRAAKEKNLAILRQRLERFQKSREEREYLEVSLETVEQTLKLVRDRVIAATTAQGIASSLDDIVLELGRHRDHMEAVEAELDQARAGAPDLSAPEEGDERERRRERERA